MVARLQTLAALQAVRHPAVPLLPAARPQAQVAHPVQAARLQAVVPLHLHLQAAVLRALRVFVLQNLKVTGKKPQEDAAALL